MNMCMKIEHGISAKHEKIANGRDIREVKQESVHSLCSKSSYTL